jgi:arylsulfatase
MGLTSPTPTIEIGRVIQAVEDMGQLDNTLIIYISGDNGASAEGMLNGTPNEFTTFNGVPVPVKAQYLWYPFWGSDKTFPHFAAPWAWAMSTPFKWVKQVPSHFGGTKQGMAISWPGHINDKGGIRHQFHHVIDIVPTILEATGIPQPEIVNGIKQSPYRRDQPEVHVGQGQRRRADPAHDAVFRDAGQSRHLSQRLGGGDDAGDPAMGARAPPRRRMSAPTSGSSTTSRKTRPSSTTSPRRCRRRSRSCRRCSMQRQRSTTCCRSTIRPCCAGNTPRPSLTAGRTVFTYSGELSGVPASAAPSILNKSYTITAEVEIPQGWRGRHDRHRGGTLRRLWPVPEQRRGGLRSGKPVFLYNLLNLKRTVWAGPELSAGKHTIVFDFKSDGPGLGKGGTGVLSVDGKEVDRKSIEHGTPVTFPEDESFDVGMDTRSGVAMLEYRYDPPFKFTGKIKKLTFKLEPEIKTVGQSKAELGPTQAPEPDPIEEAKQ